MRDDILEVIKNQNWGALENFGFERKKLVTEKFLKKKKIPRYYQKETTFLLFLL